MYTEDVELIDVENDVGHFADVHLNDEVAGFSFRISAVQIS
jgi:hypothetical protein